MLTNPRITAVEIRDFSGSGNEAGDKLRTKLVSSGMIIKKTGFYVKSKLFRKLLKEELEK
jgi:predicted nucleic acid-binding Zn ribbon protein